MSAWPVEGVQRFLDTLCQAALQREIETLCAYDTRQTAQRVARGRRNRGHNRFVGARRRVLRWNFHYILRSSCPELRVRN